MGRLVASKIAEYARSFSYERMSQEAVMKTKQLIFDALGCAVIGVGSDATIPTAHFAIEQGGRPESSMWFTRRRAPSTLAALVNGTAIHSYDLDDQYAYGAIHPGSVIVPAALALAEREEIGGRDLLASVAMGYNVMVTLGEAFFTGSKKAVSGLREGLQPNPICGVFGAAAVGGALLDSSQEVIANALGIAGSFAFGNREFVYGGGQTKALQQGGAAEAGLMSALLASHGLTGPQTIFEGGNGLFKIYLGDIDRLPTVPSLESRLYVDSISIKRFPVIYTAQTAVEALLTLVQEYRLTPEKVKKVLVRVRPGLGPPQEFLPRMKEKAPLPEIVAHTDMRFGLAVALSEENLNVKHFSRRWLADEGIREISRKIVVLSDHRFDRIDRHVAYAPSTVMVRTIEGEEYEKQVDNPRGDPRFPLDMKELILKFRRNVVKPRDMEKIERIADGVRDIENVPDTRQFCKELLLK